MDEPTTGLDSTSAHATTWFFLMGSCVPMLLLNHYPHGMEVVDRLFASTCIGATSIDVWMFAGLAVVVAGALAIWRRRVCLVVRDPIFASAAGIPPAWWSAGMALALGVGLGLALSSAGTLYTFDCLVLPALVARSWCRTLATTFIAAPANALLTVVIAFVWAHQSDLPPGPMAVALLGLVLVIGQRLRAAIAVLARAAR